MRIPVRLDLHRAPADQYLLLAIGQPALADHQLPSIHPNRLQ